jgi:ligand-binding SRPBCC domain-containing protein
MVDIHDCNVYYVVHGDHTMSLKPDNPTYQLHRETVVPRPLHEVFEFFGAPTNLDALTPPWLSFAIHNVPPKMAAGVEIEYRLRLRGVPLRWSSRISAWEPPYRFVDEQLRGPYKRWVHEHRFEVVPGGTKVVDHVDYEVPGGRLFHHLVHRLFVAPDIARIFDYRQMRLRELLARDSGAEAGDRESAA